MKTDVEVKKEFDEIALELNKSNLSFADMARVWNFFLLKLDPLQREMLFEYSANQIRNKIQRMMQEKIGGQKDGRK